MCLRGGHPGGNPFGQNPAYLLKNNFSSTFFLFFFFLIYLRLCWVFISVWGLSLVAASGGHSLLWCMGFSLRWLLLLWSMVSRHSGFSSCGMQAQQLWLTGSIVQAQQLWCTSLVAPQNVGSSRTRTQIGVPCIGRRILNHCATREALSICFYLFSKITSWLFLINNIHVIKVFVSLLYIINSFKMVIILNIYFVTYLSSHFVS